MVGNKLIDNQTLVKRMHRHQHLENAALAEKLKTGVLDLELMRDAGLCTDACADCAVVSVRFSAITFNRLTKTKEPVFDVHNSSGNYIGSYFASAFKSLAF